METGDSRRIIVIKNLSSNFIEEAILILKSDTDAKLLDQVSKPSTKKIAVKKDFLLKEAENIINDYIRENNLYAPAHRRGQKGYGVFKNKRIINTFINIALLSSVAFLLLIIIKLI